MKSTPITKVLFFVIALTVILAAKNSQITAEKSYVNEAFLLESTSYLPILLNNFPEPPELRIDDYLIRCPTPDEVASVDAVLNIQFEDDPSAPALVCTAAAGSHDLTQLQKNTYNTILLMRELEFDQPFPWTSKHLYQWFIDSIDGIRLREDIPYSFCCDPHRVINIQVADNFVGVSSQRWGDFIGDNGRNGGLYLLMGLFIIATKIAKPVPIPRKMTRCS